MGNRSLNNKGLDVCKEKLKINSYCPQDLSKIYSEEGILSRNFLIANLSSCNKIHVHLRSYVDFYGGYAEHGREVLFRLQNSGQCEVKLTPIKSLIDIDPPTMHKCSSFINNPGFKIENSIYLCIAGPGWGQEKFNPKDGRKKIIWTMIESADCNKDMKNWLDNMDEVWVPTHIDMLRFKNIVRCDKLLLMRLGYDHEKYNLNVKPVNFVGIDKDRFVFGVLGSWNKRKNVKAIIRAFCKAFSSKDPVTLLLISKYATRPYDGIKDNEKVKKDDIEKWDIKYEFKRYIKDFNNIPHISLIDIPIHENILPNIMARFNCLVGFSMGESTWLPGLQAMAMGIPVIQLDSKCSGFIDYMNEDNSFLCQKYKLIEADDELFKGTSEYYKGQKFAEGDEDELAEMMIKVYSNRDENILQKKIEKAYMNVSHWKWDLKINAVINRLKEINDGY